jgi:hypothetical protein
MSHRQHTRNAVAQQQDNIFANDKRIVIADADHALETFAARLAVTAYRVAVRHGASGRWIDLELDLWRVLADAVETWVQESLSEVEDRDGLRRCLDVRLLITGEEG